MKPRTLLVLLALTALLGAYIYFVERNQPSTDERARLDQQVLPIDMDDVMALELGSSDSRVRLERQTDDSQTDDSQTDDSQTDDSQGDEADEHEIGGAFAGALGDSLAGTSAWRLTAPIDAKADGPAVDSIVQRLVTLGKQRELDSEADDAELGLDAPRASVVLITEDDDRHSLDIGNDLPLGSGTAVRAGNAIVVASAAGDLIGDLTRPANGWRDRALVSAGRDAIERIELTAPGEAAVVVVRRDDAESFVIESPISDLADYSRVNQLLTDIAGLQALRFVDPSDLDSGLPDSGLPDTTYAIQVGLTGRSEPLRIEIAAATASTANGHRAQVGGEQVVIDATSLLEAADTPAANWRSTALSHLQVFQVERAEISDGEGKLVLERRDAEWTRDGQPIAYTAATDALYPLTEARAARLVDSATADAEGHDLTATPQITISLRAEGSSAENEQERVTIRPVVGELHAVEVAGRDAILLVPAAQLTPLLDAVASLRQAEPLLAQTTEEDDA